MSGAWNGVRPARIWASVGGRKPCGRRCRNSPTVSTWAALPKLIAGVCRSVRGTQQKMPKQSWQTIMLTPLWKKELEADWSTDNAAPHQIPLGTFNDQIVMGPDPKANPFENVPTTTPAPAQEPTQQPAQPGKPQLEAPKPTAPEAPAAAGNVIEAIEFRGARRVPQDTLRSTIGTRKGDVYNEDALHRDFMLLWNTGRFDDIRLETEPGKTGIVLRFVVTERRVVRAVLRFMTRSRDDAE